MTETPFWLWYKLEIIWLGDGEPLIHFSPVSLSQCEGRHYNSVAPAALAQESHPEYQLEMKYTFPPGSLPLSSPPSCRAPHPYHHHQPSLTSQTSNELLNWQPALE